MSLPSGQSPIGSANTSRRKATQQTDGGNHERTDGYDNPAQREEGTRALLDNLDTSLRGGPSRA